MDTTDMHRAGSWCFDQLAELPDNGRRVSAVPVPWGEVTIDLDAIGAPG